MKSALGAASLEELAEKLGEKRATVGSWSARGSVPLYAIDRAAEIANRSIDWIYKGVDGVGRETTIAIEAKGPAAKSPARRKSENVFASGERLPLNEEEARPYGPTVSYFDGLRDISFCLVPRYGARPSGGRGRGVGDAEDAVVGEIAFEASWMRSHFGRAGTGFALVDVTGSSMEPTLIDGETVMVDLQKRELVDGAIYVLRDGDELLVKRLQRMLGGTVEVVSDNKAFRCQVIEDLERLAIIGRVVWPKVR